MLSLDEVYPERVRGVIFMASAIGSQREEIYIWRLKGDYLSSSGIRERESVEFNEEVRRLSLNSRDRSTLVRRVIDAMLAEWTQPERHSGARETWAAAIILARKYLPDDKELIRRLYLIAVVKQGGYGTQYPEELVNALCPSREFGQASIALGADPKRLRFVIEVLLREGCTEDEVRAARIEMLWERFRFTTFSSFTINWWEGLVVGGRELRVDVQPVIRALLRRDIKRLLGPEPGAEILQEWSFKKIDHLVSEADGDWRQTDPVLRQLLDQQFVSCLAGGKLGLVSFVWARYARQFGLTHQVSDDFIARAIREAEQASHFGIAAALAEQVSGGDPNDRLHELARHYGQTIGVESEFKPK